VNLVPGYDVVMDIAVFLMVDTIGGIMMAAYMNNAGGSWDNGQNGNKKLLV